jgi:uncharacterized protein YjbI with pentapeptide repeats
MSSVIFKSERFTGTETLNREFEDAILLDCRFEDYALEGANLVTATFVECTFRKVDLYWARAFRAKFFRCDLEDVSFRGGNLAEAVFLSCRLVRCDFTQDNLGGDTEFGSVEFHDSKHI